MQNGHQPIGILVRQWPQKDSVHDAEDRGIRANPQRQRDHCHHRKARRVQKRAGAVSQILRKVL
jgi:hypothetical protein